MRVFTKKLRVLCMSLVLFLFELLIFVMDKKITILGLIYDNKDVLFGKFSDSLTHEMKINKWKYIADQLKGLGIFTKDWKYLRDTTWQNWRKRTIEKRDNRLQTGSGGGKYCKYDESDELVFKIIGKNSPVIEGLPVAESSGSQDPTICIPISNPSEISAAISSSPHQSTRRKSQRISTCEPDIPYDLMYLKKQKMELEVELLKEKVEIAKREKYKLDLELLKLEKELNVMTPSNFTLPTYCQNVEIVGSSLPKEPQAINIVYSVEQEEGTNDILQEAINKTL